MSERLITDAERRARLGRRHGLAPSHRRRDVEEAARTMTVLHATEAPTVHLALWARVESVEVEDVDRALYEDRTMVKQLAMRRTLFVFPRDLLPAAWGSAAARVALQQRSQILKDVAKAGLTTDPEAWLDRARAGVLARLAGGEALAASRLRDELPELSGTISYAPGRKWGGQSPIAPRVLTLLGAEGRIVRGRNAGHWRLNRPTWTTTEAWLGEAPRPSAAEEGYAELVRRWLWTFGPGTETDLAWWLGATKAAVRHALTDTGAVPVALESGATGWVLADDLDPVDPVEPYAALLPTLDPTVMGWKERGFYLDAGHAPYLFDTNGNAGNTAWWDGRVVGAWVQDDDARVRVVPSEVLSPDAIEALDAEAARLTSWLDGVRITNVYASLQMKRALLR